MTITLPDEMRAQLERDARAGGFATVDEYVAEALRTDRSDTAGSGPPGMSPRSRAELDAMLDAGVASGPPIRMTPEFWQERERELARRMAARRGGTP
ncbi:hypothetical protein : Putative addiction module antidote protein, CC2985 family OS=Singulisphaera acidiphila (strain ATCC BAA-1392 / DSM 18658 / VKM B-2454 / MOB10) GN=Sinac_0976 PE=4 SV=1: RHH_1 [Gemmataceae bacterium]|nr:hypothetical protein : Putative addiction module antidote protein, CC2985 family OS=Singulisphaera acidiphila (strain ATCC BAA-1392 / DSM 18658 / VKM B-2454 / MOB10) GN=Sinac_0976 PE=4 SV=1: RHH_1 [Gemmataceae bacterium]VTU02303.1 hypothetical protein : Putative addiction module antidote protein, CC2985 family OS=Singulisphaera acidiphila (strain ATCC BAA-1392 / DSM 18658 / VKM B-2454 / MOB10) GN=Sinac_0976 PE=4 SV=1: RHH_1 [Gemmataceae bacterium]